MSLDLLTNNTLTPFRATITFDQYGGELRTMNAIGVAQSCVLMQARTIVKDQFSRRGQTISHMAVMGVSLGVSVGDTCQDGAGNTYKVIENTDDGGRGKVFTVVLQQMLPD